MEEILRRIIKEELRKALLEMTEPAVGGSGEHIIYNFEAGRAFGVNKLAKDIDGLGHYYMSSYFPHSEMKESWMFEIETNYGGYQIVEILHKLNEQYDSVWKLNIAEVERGSEEPQIIDTTGDVTGYDNFIQIVNSRFSQKINPELL